MANEGYETLVSSRSRLRTADVGVIGLRRHVMYGLLEVDVTEARRDARRLRRGGHEVSFTAWMIKAIGDSVAGNRGAHAMKWGERRLVIFDDVDIAIPVERAVAGVDEPLPLLIKRVNHKSVYEISGELETAIRKPIGDERDLILGEHGFSRTALRLYLVLPRFIRVAIMGRLFADPFRAQRLGGSVLVTTVNAVGKSAGWILPTRSLHTLSIALGSVTRKPWVVDGAVAVREIMHVTVSLDHDAIDGVPARRFVQDLVRTIERGRIGEETAGG
jgi:hypothetical protein